MNEYVVNLDAADLDARLQEGSGTLLVDFWAPWCGPCVAFAPMIDELATDYQGRATVAKLDVEACEGVYERFNVRGIPTLIVFKDGIEVARHTGGLNKTRLTMLLDKHL